MKPECVLCAEFDNVLCSSPCSQEMYCLGIKGNDICHFFSSDSDTTYLNVKKKERVKDENVAKCQQLMHMDG